MEQLLSSNEYTIQSKIRWFPSLTTRFQILNDADTKVGEIVFHPVLMAPVLWVFGLLLEVGLVGLGGYLVFKSNAKTVGFAVMLSGAFLMLIVQLRSFLSSRASSSVEIFSSDGKKLLSARKGWALWKPTFTIRNAEDDSLIGKSRQSFFWGDRHYHLWDGNGQSWGTIQRRILGFQYRIFKGKEQVGRFRRKLLDARKLITGMRSYSLSLSQPNLTIQERALILGSIAYVDVLTRQKKLREETQTETPTPKQKQT